MRNVPRDLGGCVDRTLCPYKGYFPKIECVLRKCNTCGTAKFHREILKTIKIKLKMKGNTFLLNCGTPKERRRRMTLLKVFFTGNLNDAITMI